MEQNKKKLQNLLDMSVLSYLTTLSSSLVILKDEKTNIATSLNALRNHLQNWEHYDDIIESFDFGSYQRETILPRWADPDSDVDYMIVFKNPNNYQPQTFLIWLRAFVEAKYPRSYDKQSFPTIALELQHIRFELVPAIKPWGYMIPTKEFYYNSWQNTDPLALKTRVSSANSFNSCVRPLIRIMKYWNALNGKPYASYELEMKIANHLFWGCANLEDCLYSFVESMTVDFTLPNYKKNIINSLKQKVFLAKQQKLMGLNIIAEQTISSIFKA